jgi:protein-disulfide isomerase
MADCPDVQTEGARCPTPHRAVLWLARAMAVLALGIVVYLLGASLLARGQVAGCGDGTEGGCGRVLASRWSEWLLMPVALPAAILYAVMLRLLFRLRPGPRSGDQRTIWQLLVVLAAVLGGAACWFLGLQVLLLQSFCGFCVAAHACGLALAGFILWYSPIPWRGGRDQAPADSAGRRATAPGLILLGLAGMAVLMAGQLLVAPRPRDMKLVEVFGPAGGRITVDPAAHPRFGPPRAKYVVVELFDYTCPHCRLLDGYLAEARRRYGDQLTVLPLVVPLHPECNAYVDSVKPGKEHACAYARLALAVWRTKPDAFEAFHRWLLDSAPSPEAARQRAAELLGAEGLDQALADERLRDEIAANVKVYMQLGGGLLPKLIYRDHVTEGKPASARQLFDFLEDDVGLPPPGVARVPIHPRQRQGSSPARPGAWPAAAPACSRSRTTTPGRSAARRATCRWPALSRKASWARSAGRTSSTALPRAWCRSSIDRAALCRRTSFVIHSRGWARSCRGRLRKAKGQRAVPAPFPAAKPQPRASDAGHDDHPRRRQRQGIAEAPVDGWDSLARDREHL